MTDLSLWGRFVFTWKRIGNIFSHFWDRPVPIFSDARFSYLALVQDKTLRAFYRQMHAVTVYVNSASLVSERLKSYPRVSEISLSCTFAVLDSICLIYMKDKPATHGWLRCDTLHSSWGKSYREWWNSGSWWQKDKALLLHTGTR